MVTKQTVNSFNNNIILKIFKLIYKTFSFTMYKQKQTFYYLQRIKVGFLKRNFFKKGKSRNFKNDGSLVIKEFYKKQGILKPGNFFQKHIILNFLKTQL